jgi:exo-beta-1,3-glucanase (GH17 family)
MDNIVMTSNTSGSATTTTAITTTTINTVTTAVSTALPDDTPEIPRQHLDTIAQVWEEWEDGLEGLPNNGRCKSIKQMDAEFQKNWRRSDVIRKRYERRKNIVERLRCLVNKYGMEVDVVIERVESWRRKKKYSIDLLGKKMHKDPAIDPKKEGWTDEELMSVAEMDW